MSPKQAAERKAEQDLGIVRDSSIFGKRAEQFNRWVDERESLREVEKNAKEARGYKDDRGNRVPGIDDSIYDMLADIKAVMLPDGRKVQVVERAGNSYIDKVLLAENGVPATTIAKCTRRGAPSWHILVTEPKKSGV